MDEHMENYNVESSAIHRKLQSKVEALNIMRKELEHYRTERDQFKLMAETLQMRYSAIKKSLIDTNSLDDIVKGSTVTEFVNKMREKNIALTTEVEQLRQKLLELNGDIELLRNKNVNTNNNSIKRKSAYSSSSSCNDIIDHNSSLLDKEYKSDMIAQLEKLKKSNAQLQYDFRSLLDEKEEIVTERDAYKCKAHRLNHELCISLKGNKSQLNVLDIDALILENKLLQEKLRNIESELELSQQSCSKYKTMLEAKRKKGIIKFGTNQSDMIMSHKQAKALLENGTLSELPTKAETISDLKSLCLALLDNVNDKNLALSHQKKANKILGLRITELEQRLQSICCVTLNPNDSENTNSIVSFSPSDILLNGYCSSAVDKESKTIKSNCNGVADNNNSNNNDNNNNNNNNDNTDNCYVATVIQTNKNDEPDDDLTSEISYENQFTATSSLLKLRGGTDVEEHPSSVSQALNLIGNIQQFSSDSNQSGISSECNSSSIRKSDYSSNSTTVSEMDTNRKLLDNNPNFTNSTLEIIDYDELPPNVVKIIKQSLKEYKLKNIIDDNIIIHE